MRIVFKIFKDFFNQIFSISFNSVLGFEKEDSIKGYLTNIPQSFTPAKEDLVIEGIIAEFDEVSRKCTEIKRIREF
jgi:calcineurin-like phosphoesterase